MKRAILLSLLMCSLLMATVTVTTVKTGELDCDGSTTEFSFDFPYAATSEVSVDVWTDDGDVASRQTETTHFSVSPSSSTSGGTVTFVTAPADGNYVVISRTTTATQSGDIDAGAYISKTAIEDALDKGVRVGQEHADAITRSIRAPQGEVGTDLVLPGALARAGGYIIFSSTGALTIGTAFLPTSAAVSTFMETVLDDITAAAARTTLGAYGANDSPTFVDIVATSITGGGTGVQTGFTKTVTDDTNGKTLTVAESGTLQTNAGASGAAAWTLPTAVAGYEYFFVVGAAQELRVTPAAGDKINHAGTLAAAAEYYYADAIGEALHIVAIDATQWVVITETGTWAEETP